MFIDMLVCSSCNYTLTEVIFHKNIYGAFLQYFNLECIELLEGLLCLEQMVFQDCKSLKEIVIPVSVQFFGNHAFERCVPLQRVVFASDYFNSVISTENKT